MVWNPYSNIRAVQLLLLPSAPPTAVVRCSRNSPKTYVIVFALFVELGAWVVRFLQMRISLAGNPKIVGMYSDLLFMMHKEYNFVGMQH